MRPSHGVIALVCLITTALLLGGCDRNQEASSASDGSRASDVTQVAHSHENGETCFVCDATKRDAGRLWCTEHARYEDRCWICQPQLEDPSRPYCEEHYLYEDECHLCNPTLGASENAADESAGGLHGHGADEPEKDRTFVAVIVIGVALTLALGAPALISLVYSWVTFVPSTPV